MQLSSCFLCLFPNFTASKGYKCVNNTGYGIAKPTQDLSQSQPNMLQSLAVLEYMKQYLQLTGL